MKNDILQRYIEGNSSQEEKEKVAKWLDADEKNLQQFMLFRSAYDASLWNYKSQQQEDVISIPKSKVYTLLRSRIITELFKVAAIFIIAFGCYYLFFSSDLQTLKPDFTLQTVYAPEGERAEIILTDGTKVWLNAKSSLKFPNQFSEDERLVELDGEAYFDVAHDDTKKFIVQTDNYKVKVHGTEFNVNAYHENDYFETALIRGSVEIVRNNSNESIMLEPNDKVYSDGNDLVVTDISTLDPFLWKEGILYFQNLNMKDLFKKLEIYYGVEIETRNKKILTHQYTGKFWINDGVEHILRVLQLDHDFKYVKNSTNKIIIY